MRFLPLISVPIALSSLTLCASIHNGAGRIAARASSPLDVVTSPPAVGSTTVPDFGAAWDAAYAKAQAAVKKMSAADKALLTAGPGLGGGTCSGNLLPIKSINFPGMCLEDGPMAIRPTNQTTAFPAGINAAATFNRALIRARSAAMGEEFRGKGAGVAFMPAINMARVPSGGRNWEGFGADPFLTGEAAYESVLGLQSTGVQANAKHLVANEQEHARFSSNSIVDDRTLHEIYLYPFLKSMMAGVASLMCAENRVNGDFACSSNAIQNKIVKQLYGYRGYILSDFLATKATSDALNGLDMSMPGNAANVTIPVASADISPNGVSFFGANLTTNGFPAARLDEMATKILASYFLLKQDSNVALSSVRFSADVRSAAHTKVARDVAAASVILLKNNKAALPLSKAKLAKGLAVIGSDARPPTSLALISAWVGLQNDGALGMGWGSGAATYTTFAAPSDALAAQAKTDGTTITAAFDDFNLQSAAAAATGKSAALVFVKTMSGEGQIVPPLESSVDGINRGDRNNISAWNGGDDLIKAVAAVNKNTIVIVNSVGQMDVEQWADHPNVTAIIWAGVPGQETGNALTDILYGKVNPSGRLPYTVAKKLSDYPAHVVDGGHNDKIPINYSEKLLVDYRHFDAKNITPRFEFGLGLSYTTFAYSNIKVTKSVQPIVGAAAQNWVAGRTASGNGVSTQAWLHSRIATVSFTLKNTGSVAGTEIPQLYLSYPASAGEPPRVLRGFENVSLKAGESKTVSLNITPLMLSIWDSAGQGWKRPAGAFGFNVGSSSRNIKLTASATVV